MWRGAFTGPLLKSKMTGKVAKFPAGDSLSRPVSAVRRGSFRALPRLGQRTTRAQLLPPRRYGDSVSELTGHRDIGHVLLDVLHALLDLRPGWCNRGRKFGEKAAGLMPGGFMPRGTGLAVCLCPLIQVG